MSIYLLLLTTCCTNGFTPLLNFVQRTNVLEETSIRNGWRDGQNDFRKNQISNLFLVKRYEQNPQLHEEFKGPNCVHGILHWQAF